MKSSLLQHGCFPRILFISLIGMIPGGQAQNQTRQNRCVVNANLTIPAVAGIDLEKWTNGEDADTPPGPSIQVGQPVIWTYRVKNTGNVPLVQISVSDNSPGIDPVYQSGDANENGILEYGEIWIYTAASTAVAGQYANQGSATGFYEETSVTDTDPSHYLGTLIASPNIGIETLTNDEDADLPPGPILTEGENITWEYRIINKGNVALTGIKVTDDRIGTVGTLPALLPGKTRSLFATGTAMTGQYSNTGSVSGFYEGIQVTDTDPSHYLGVSLIPQGELTREILYAIPTVFDEYIALSMNAIGAPTLLTLEAVNTHGDLLITDAPALIDTDYLPRVEATGQDQTGRIRTYFLLLHPDDPAPSPSDVRWVPGNQLGRFAKRILRAGFYRWALYIKVYADQTAPFGLYSGNYSICVIDANGKREIMQFMVNAVLNRRSLTGRLDTDRVKDDTQSSRSIIEIPESIRIDSESGDPVAWIPDRVDIESPVVPEPVVIRIPAPQEAMRVWLEDSGEEIQQIASPARPRFIMQGAGPEVPAAADFRWVSSTDLMSQKFHIERGRAYRLRLYIRTPEEPDLEKSRHEIGFHVVAENRQGRHVIGRFRIRWGVRDMRE